ncbi:hypothetical protein PM8797T_21108 [Gimesia maris DSM 8797]|nr:hypothetical protein PM8797T_21108 [Gimesia maris DSM 8797]
MNSQGDLNRFTHFIWYPIFRTCRLPEKTTFSN